MALSPAQAAAVAYEAGFRGSDLVLMVAIAMGESGLRPDASGDESLQTGTWGPSLGLWQVRSIKSQWGTGQSRDGSRLMDPRFNARSAFSISGGGTNFKPWTVYTKGIYRQYLGQAQVGVNKLGANGEHVQKILGSVKAGTQAGWDGSGGGGGYGSNDFVGDQGYQSMGAPADEAKRLYGYLGWFVDHGEVGPIILQAAEQGWDISRLLGALSKTSWWKKTSETARKWDSLRTMDPATAERRVDETALSIAMQASKFGLKFSTKRLSDLAVKALRFGWNPQEIQLAIAAEMRYNPKAAYGGGVGQMMNQVKAAAANYLVPITKKQAWEWARRMVSGVGTMEAVEAQMNKLAKTRFPHLAKLIDQGIVPAQYFAPHQQAIASLLEISPESVNLMDTRWNPVMAFRSDAKSPLRTMTLTEASRFARMQPEWKKTNNAYQSVAETGDEIMSMFGAVKR